MPTYKANQKGLNPNCKCPKISCRRHGDCKACKRHHRNDLAFCQMSTSESCGNEFGLLHSRFGRQRSKVIAYEVLKQLVE